MCSGQNQAILQADIWPSSHNTICLDEILVYWKTRARMFLKKPLLLNLCRLAEDYDELDGGKIPAALGLTGYREDLLSQVGSNSSSLKRGGEQMGAYYCAVSG